VRYPGFINGTGELASLHINAERTVNLYPEIVDAGTGKSEAWLKATPGLSLFATLGNGPIRSLFYRDGRAFAVSGDRYYEFFTDGTSTLRGTLNSDTRPAQIQTSGAIGRQNFVVSGMGGYIHALDTNAWTTIAEPGFPAGALSGLFADSYFLVLHNGTPKFSFSGLANGLTWGASDIAQKSQTSDNLVGWAYESKELWLFGSELTEVWVNTGDLRNPWSPQPVLVPSGLAAQDSVANAPGGGLFWLHGTPRGGRTVMRSNGYRPVRISSHALDTALAGYSRVDDAIGFCYEESGHVFYILTFPTAGATWRYDLTSGVWTEWLYWNSGSGVYEAHLGRCHTLAFDKHLVGSRVDGKIYQLSNTVYTDNSATIRRLRRAPHVAAHNKNVFHHRFELDMRTGVGLLAGVPGAVDPQMFMRYSNDGGTTWTNELWASLGPYQQYERRVYWDGLGESRNRVYEVVTSDAVSIAIADAFLELTGGVQ
jgi:hypothetical protein